MGNANDVCSAFDATLQRQIRCKLLDDDEIEDEVIKELYEKCNIVGNLLRERNILITDSMVLSSFAYGKKRKWNIKKFKNYLLGDIEFNEIIKVLVNIFIKQDEYLFKTPDEAGRLIGESSNGIKRKMCPIFGALSKKLVDLDYDKNVKCKLFYGGKKNRNELG